MKDEIKEILDKLKETADYPKINYSSYDKTYNETIDNIAMIKSPACKQLLDYITNLQEENERLKEENKRIFSKVNDDELLISNAMNYAEAQKYKSRNEKAIERLKMLPIDKLKNINKYTALIVEETLNILQGEEKDDK